MLFFFRFENNLVFSWLVIITYFLWLYLAFPEKNCTPMLRGINFFLKLTLLDFQSILSFFISFFCIIPFGNLRFSLKFWHTPLEFKLLLPFTPPPGIFHWYPRQGVFDFFSRKAHFYFLFLEEEKKLVWGSHGSLNKLSAK